MKSIGYIRVSTDSQDFDKQKHLLLQDAQAHRGLIHEFIEVEISSQKNTQARRIDFNGHSVPYLEQDYDQNSGRRR